MIHAREHAMQLLNQPLRPSEPWAGNLETYEEMVKGIQRDAIREFAHWADGKQMVGTCGLTLDEAFAQLLTLMSARWRLSPMNPANLGENPTLKALRYALSLVEGRTVLRRTPDYIAACDDMKIFLEASIERVQSGEQMEATADCSSDLPPK